MMMSSSTNVTDENPFKSLLEAAPDGIIVCDQGGEILLANSQCEALFGFQLDELIGEKIERLVPSAIANGHVRVRDQYFATPRKRPMGMGLDLLAQKKDGGLLPVEISLSPFTFQGRPCAIAIIRDVTELRRLSRELKQNNAELKRSNEDLDQFASIASHDLQEPLRMVAGYTQLLARRCQGQFDSEAQDYIHHVVDGAKRMQALITDLLAYSRLSTRTHELAHVDMNRILRQVLSNLDATIHEQNAVIEAESLPPVVGDPVQLTQVLQNLISNAIKFHKKAIAPRVSIRGRTEGQTAFFEVEDNGIGIKASYLDKIFVIFQRLHSQDEYPGTGIGLAICKKIIERHGGSIHVASILGSGTTFHFTLPIKVHS